MGMLLSMLSTNMLDRLELLSDEAAIYRAVTNKPLKGREIAEWFAAIFLNWPDGRWEKKSSKGQRIAVEFDLHKVTMPVGVRLQRLPQGHARQAWSKAGMYSFRQAIQS